MIAVLLARHLPTKISGQHSSDQIKRHLNLLAYRYEKICVPVVTEAQPMHVRFQATEFLKYHRGFEKQRADTTNSEPPKTKTAAIQLVGLIGKNKPSQLTSLYRSVEKRLSG
ncbi:hypothetical protein [Rheinheimera mangrovi]|uniref:hypothetical protein n=1 Tax=Rheinheimera mangrovi TaxID=2498451 RepID=UPI0013DE8A99|nr:hypothetical protein [Rheinheimera mangrovi]